ncbi:hypothetical protein [Pseudomonas saponiphila]|uniref:hypothetical protein n=1 Tax=Pseudomonas saponiphila TaxID=556534 RepID=UPI003906964F
MVRPLEIHRPTLRNLTLSSEAKMTGDLFEVDKRLALKPIVDFNSYLRAAFTDGPCTCGRCVASQGDETGYEHSHSFNFAGKVANRRFATTAGSDVLLALKKAWLSFTKAELPGSGNLDLATVKEFVEPELHKRLLPLFVASGLVQEVDGQLQIQAQVAA